MLRPRAPLVLDLPGQAWFAVRLMRKDIRLVLDAAGELAVPVGSAVPADRVLARAEELGYGHRDIAALFRVIAETAEGPAHAGAGPPS